MPGRLASHAIVCRGFSARETRNQVVLFALEHVAREVLRSSHRSPLQAVGAGWTPGEAKYRALNHLSLAWAKQSGELDAAEPFSFTDSRGEKMRRYLLDALHAASVHPASFVRTMAPTGLIVARAVSESGAAGWGVGLRETEACVNALAALACDALPLESVGEEVVPALITLRSEAWRDLLACAARHRDGQSFDLNSWNARQLLPFCADLAWIALLRVRCE
jgi:hypothetical protein